MSDPSPKVDFPGAPGVPTSTDGSELEDTAARMARGKLLEHLLDDETDLDEAFDRLTASAGQEDGGFDDLVEAPEDPVLKAVLPGDTMASGDMTLAVLLASVLSEYEDIERLLEGLKESEQEGEGLEADAVAVVSEAELADPEALSQALEPLQERDRFEQLFDTAKGALDRLDIYELSKKPTNDVVRELRSQGSLRTVQSLVDFLRSLNTAAATFEAMAMPQPHIREYLRHLYLMQDWDEMSRLVSVLEVAVSQLGPDGSAQKGTAPDPGRTG